MKNMQASFEIWQMKGNKKKFLCCFFFPSLFLHVQARSLQLWGIIIFSLGKRMSELETCLQIDFRRTLRNQTISEQLVMKQEMREELIAYSNRNSQVDKSLKCLQIQNVLMGREEFLNNEIKLHLVYLLVPVLPLPWKIRCCFAK